MTDFHDVRFPLDLAFGTRGGPVRPVEILQLANGSEVRNARGRHSRRQYNAVAGLKSKEQAIELIHFFESRKGPLHGFRFRDPLDFDAQSTLGIADGQRTTFALTKEYGSAPHVYTRRITKPVADTVKVSVDGVEMAVSIDAARGEIHFSTAPNAGAVISASFEFDVPVRFDAAALDISLEDFGSTQIQDMPLIEILCAEEVDDD